LTHLLFYDYYYRFREHRKQIKNLVIANNHEAAISKLDTVIEEHNNYITSRNIENNGNTFTSLDSFSLRHAKNHTKYIDIPIQKQAVIDALDEQ
jgi:hypothetical protein